MFDLSLFETAFIVVVAFLIFGPEQFPAMLRKAFGLIQEVKKYSLQAQQAFTKYSRQIEGELDPGKWGSSSKTDQAQADRPIETEEAQCDDDDGQYETTPYDVYSDEQDVAEDKDEAYKTAPIDRYSTCSDHALT